MYGDFEVCYEVPYRVLYEGKNINAFARGLKSIPYICLCNKKPLENKIKLFIKYYQYDLAVADRNDMLLRELGLPEYYQNIIKCSGISYGLEWLKLIKFRENLCFECNISPIRKKNHYFNDLSQFEQNYDKEIEKHFYNYGIGYKLVKHYGIYFLQEQVPEKLLKIIKPEKAIIKKEVLEYALMDNYTLEESLVEKNLDIIFNQCEDIRNIVLYDQLNNKEKLRYYNIEKELKLDDIVMEYVDKCIWKRFLNVKKIIFNEVKDLDKRIKEEINNGGKEIFIDIMKDGLKIKIQVNKLKKEIIVEPSFDERKKFKLEKDIFNVILEKIDFRKISTWTKEEGDCHKNIEWFVMGEFGIEESISNSGKEMPEGLFNNLVDIFNMLSIDDYIKSFM